MQFSAICVLSIVIHFVALLLNVKKGHKKYLICIDNFYFI